MVSVLEDLVMDCSFVSWLVEWLHELLQSSSRVFQRVVRASISRRSTRRVSSHEDQGVWYGSSSQMMADVLERGWLVLLQDSLVRSCGGRRQRPS